MTFQHSDRVEERLNEAEVDIKIRWARGIDALKWWMASIYLVLGKKGSGKSALLEALGLRYRRIIDLFGSRDNENLCWLRDTSPIDDILLVIGDNVDLQCSWPTVHASGLTLKHILGHEVIVTCNDFFNTQSSRFTGINKIIDQFWLRKSWNYPIYVAIREASSFLYSRIKLEGVNMKMAKADFIYFQREMRHMGFSLGIDTIRWTSIDKEMRDLADYLIIKKVGPQGLPKDIRYLYKYCNPQSLAAMKPDRFILQTDNAAIGYGWSGLPKFHKREGENLMEELGLRPEYGEELEESTAQQVGTEEHIKIIQLRAAEESMDNISKKVHRSSATVYNHIQKHNAMIEQQGACPTCKRGNGDLFDYIVP